MKLPYGLDKRELSNLSRWARNPVHACLLAAHIIFIVWDSLLLRLLPAQWRYPYRVRIAARAASHQGTVFVERATHSETTPLGPARLKLAIGYFYFERDPEWKSSFDDQEQYVSLHRWNWLLHALVDEDKPVSFSWGVHMMRSWLHAMEAVPIGLASESYTLGERIANALLFGRLAGGGWHCLPGDIVQSLRQMALELCRQIEYYGTRATGNHPLNNARALYFAGKSLNLPQLDKVARTVIEERLSLIVEADGFMREGSSHYHLLFTRWLLELNFAAGEFEDKLMLDLLKHPTRLGLQRSLFFLVRCGSEEFQLPLVGDVSPDCAPVWLVDLPHSVLAQYDQYGVKPLVRELTGWARLWDFSNNEPLAIRQTRFAPFMEVKHPFQSFPRSGWHRLDWHGWTAIWRTQAGGSAAHASHEHHDFASFVLYYCGREVLIDVGRPSYDRGSAVGTYAMSPLAHNSITLEGLGPMLTARDHFFPPGYRKGTVSLSCIFKGDLSVIDLTHDGWARLAGRRVKHRRRFCFAPRKVKVLDFFFGDREVGISMAFHWANTPGLAGGFVRLERDVKGVRILEDQIKCSSPEGTYGWRFPAYGERLPCASQVISGIAALPALISHRITIEE